MIVSVIKLSLGRDLIDVTNLLAVQADVLNELLDQCDDLIGRGFQEINGYRDRTAVLSIGGSWRGDSFIVSSFGWRCDGEWIYSTDHGIERKRV
ncbi:hypothetical protein SH501x_000865 [Pirellulaceae bacterium SH501]